jgi:hypothetical protein
MIAVFLILSAITFGTDMVYKQTEPDQKIMDEIQDYIDQKASEQ